jgi:hypothetical protein
LTYFERNDILMFTQHCEQVIKETMESHYKNLDAQQRHTTPIYYSLLPQARCHPGVAQASPGIDIPIQADSGLQIQGYNFISQPDFTCS